MIDLAAEDERRRREAKLGDFALGGLLTAIQASLGQALPSEEDARDLVRLGRVVFSEIDQPTAAKAPSPDEDRRAREATEPSDLVEELFGLVPDDRE